MIELKALGTKLPFWKNRGATASQLGIKQLVFAAEHRKEHTVSGASYYFHRHMKVFNLPTVNCGIPLQNIGEEENQIAWQSLLPLCLLTSPLVQVLPESDILLASEANHSHFGAWEAPLLCLS